MLTSSGFRPRSVEAESWSRAPRTEVMPDRFVLIGFTGGARLEWPFPNAVAEPAHPRTQSAESRIGARASSAGDLVVGEDFAWIWDFEKAIAGRHGDARAVAGAVRERRASIV